MKADSGKYTVTSDEIVEALLRPIDEALQETGLTPKYLTKKLKRELGAKKTTHIKVRGVIDKESTTLPRGIKIISESSDETVIAISQIDWGTRQKARIDTHKLRGDYPAEKRQLSGKLDIQHSNWAELMDEVAKPNSDELPKRKNRGR